MLALIWLLVATDVQRMVDEAPEGSVVELPPGEFVGNLRIGRPITLRGAGAGKTILSAAGWTVVSVHARSGVVRIEGLSITGGSSPWGGGIGCTRFSAALVVEDVEIFGNHGSSGGGIACHGPLTLRRVWIHDNTSKYGGGIGIAGNFEVVIESSAFERNYAQEEGGGLHATVDRLELRDSLFSENYAGVGAHHAQFGWSDPRSRLRQQRHENLFVLERVFFGATTGRPVVLGAGIFEQKVIVRDTNWAPEPAVEPRP